MSDELKARVEQKAREIYRRAAARHQRVYAKLHNGEGRRVIESEDIAQLEAADEIVRLLLPMAELLTQISDTRCAGATESVCPACIADRALALFNEDGEGRGT